VAASNALRASIGNSNALFRQRTREPTGAGGGATVGLARCGRDWGVIAERLGGLMGVRQRRSWRFPTGCRQRAERCPAGSWPLRVVFLVSPSASCPAGCHAATAGGARGAVVRFLKRAVLFEVGEDGGEFFDAGHDPHRAAAVAARAHVNVDQIAWSDLEQPKDWPEGRRAGCPE